MSLPESIEKPPVYKKNIFAIALPVIVLTLLGVILVASIFIPKLKTKDQGSKKQDIGYYTNKVKVNSEGKTIEVSPRVLQISPKDLHQALQKKEVILITIMNEKGDQNKPHIRGTAFTFASSFDSLPNLDPKNTHVFVSDDGYESAVVIEKFVGSLFPREKNLNLEGGLQAWKKEGFPVEN